MGSLEEDHRRLHEAARRQIFAPQGPEQEISLPVQGLFPVPNFFHRIVVLNTDNEFVCRLVITRRMINFVCRLFLLVCTRYSKSAKYSCKVNMVRSFVLKHEGVGS